MRKIVVLSGAGISAESGLKTFRDSDGLWENHDVTEVATPEAWARNPELVQRFYNERRKQLFEVEPNAGHRALVDLEKKYDVTIVTQNVDNLHEKAGSSKVLHLHGTLTQARSSIDPSLVYDIEGWELKMGDRCEKGSQLRPHIVWFGEAVPEIPRASEMVQWADILIIIGTSLNVYPAAGLVNYAGSFCDKYLIDPNGFAIPGIEKLTVIQEKAGTGVPSLVKKLLEEA